ncbi:MAG: hypothetical protein U5K72_18225 [Balneolaceae bacterium]|nr:hypothetical protein [Balneolaceae bacterium]
MKDRRVFATTGDQIEIDFRLNEAFQGESLQSFDIPMMEYRIQAADDIERVDILRNSRIVRTFKPKEPTSGFDGEFV